MNANEALILKEEAYIARGHAVQELEELFAALALVGDSSRPRSW